MWNALISSEHSSYSVLQNRETVNKSCKVVKFLLAITEVSCKNKLMLIFNKHKSKDTRELLNTQILYLKVLRSYPLRLVIVN